MCSVTWNGRLGVLLVGVEDVSGAVQGAGRDTLSGRTRQVRSYLRIL